MNVLVKIIVLLLISLFGLFMNAQESHTITDKVTDISSNEGQVMVALYNSELNFLETIYKGGKSSISNNSCEVSFENIPEGVYAVSTFHDKNMNEELDTNFFGIPKEKYGCSNNVKNFLSPPKWKDAKFELRSDTTITITL